MRPIYKKRFGTCCTQMTRSFNVSVFAEPREDRDGVVRVRAARGLTALEQAKTEVMCLEPKMAEVDIGASAIGQEMQSIRTTLCTVRVGAPSPTPLRPLIVEIACAAGLFTGGYSRELHNQPIINISEGQYARS